MFKTLLDSIQKDKRRAVQVAAVAGIVIIAVVIIRLVNSGNGEVAKAFANLAGAETFHIKANLDLNLPVQLRTQQRPIVGVTARVEGDVINQQDTPQLTGSLYTEARGRGMVLFADGQIRILPDHVSFNLDNLPTLLNPRGTLVEKWTKVEVPLLKTNNTQDVTNALVDSLDSMEFVGRESLPGTEDISAKRYQRSFTPEEEDALAEALRQGKTGNRALHIITRLLRAFDVRSFNVWVVDDTIRRIEATFGLPEDAEPRGVLTLEFSEFGKKVVIEDTPTELTVQPEVFGRIFGRGELEEF